MTHHPDTEVAITGEVIPDMDKIVELVTRAHLKMAPRVPLIGWDVALTEEVGMCLLEGNLSCNFFRGQFDQPAYFSFMEEYLLCLERRRAVSSQAHKKRSATVLENQGGASSSTAIFGSGRTARRW